MDLVTRRSTNSRSVTAKQSGDGCRFTLRNRDRGRQVAYREAVSGREKVTTELVSASSSEVGGLGLPAHESPVRNMSMPPSFTFKNLGLDKDSHGISHRIGGPFYLGTVCREE